MTRLTITQHKRVSISLIVKIYAAGATYRLYKYEKLHRHVGWEGRIQVVKTNHPPSSYRVCVAEVIGKNGARVW